MTVTERLELLAQAVESGADRVDPGALIEARELLVRSGNRMRLSAEHTVVALAGGTGSGKSSLFNALCGLDLSRVAVRRPTTSHTHACVWGLDGAGPLLDWLDIGPRYRYARTTGLSPAAGGSDDAQLRGLVLLDLPDHDSSHAGGEAARVIGAADLIVWVLDPQKYADASTHHRYITRLAGHEAVTVFVLNQADRLAPEDLVDCVNDLRDLLKREGLDDPRIITTSATTGRGLDGLRGVLADEVAKRHAAGSRIDADLDRIQGGLVKEVAADLPAAVEPGLRTKAVDALYDASGARAVGEALEYAYIQRVGDWVGWPVTRWVRLLRRDPLTHAALPGLRDDIREVGEGPAGAQPAEVENAVMAFTDAVGRDLPPVWRGVLSEVARERSAGLPGELSAALSTSSPRLERIPGWWRLVKVWQHLLLLVFAAIVALAAIIGGYQLPGMAPPPHPLLGDTGALPWLAAAAVGAIGLGLLTALACRNAGAVRGDAERARLEDDARERVAGVTASSLVEPVEAELRRHDAFRTAVYGLRRARS